MPCDTIQAKLPAASLNLKAKHPPERAGKWNLKQTPGPISLGTGDPSLYSCEEPVFLIRV